MFSLVKHASFRITSSCDKGHRNDDIPSYGSISISILYLINEFLIYLILCFEPKPLYCTSSVSILTICPSPMNNPCTTFHSAIESGWKWKYFNHHHKIRQRNGKEPLKARSNSNSAWKDLSSVTEFLPSCLLDFRFSVYSVCISKPFYNSRQVLK